MWWRNVIEESKNRNNIDLLANTSFHYLVTHTKNLSSDVCISNSLEMFSLFLDVVLRSVPTSR